MSNPFPRLGRRVACGMCGEYPPDPRQAEELRLLRELERKAANVVNSHSTIDPEIADLECLLAALDRHREGR